MSASGTLVEYGDYMSGVKSGVSGTPAFFLNGARHDGPWDEASLIAGIEAAGKRRP